MGIQQSISAGGYYVPPLSPLPTPNAPVISASGINTTENRVLIQFTANAVKYEVYHADDILQTNIALLDGNVTKNYFVHTGLTAGTTRFYFVKAVNNDGAKSAFSTGVSATTLIGHPRKLIRDKVFNLLSGSVTFSAAAVNILKSRAIPIQQIKLPTVVVYGKNEINDHRDSFPRTNWNDFDLVTQIMAEADTGEGGEDTCNEISNQVEGILGVNRAGLGLDAVDELNYEGGGFRIDKSGEKNVISLIQAYTTRYQKQFPSENDVNTWGAPLVDFITQRTDIDVGVAGEIDSETDLQ